MFCAIGLLWLSFGTPIWLLDLATGSGMILTSPLVHVVAPIIACLALRRLGWPRRAWMGASLASIALVAISRLVGSSGPNVNLAFRVHQGWEARFPSHTLFLLLFIVVSSSLFILLDRIYARLFRRA